MITYPIIHLNGTSRGRLLDELREASDAILAALKAHSAAQPNARDYYLVAGRFEHARREFEARDAKLRDVYREVQALAFYVANDACAHESVLTPDGHGASCRYCGEATA